MLGALGLIFSSLVSSDNGDGLEPCNSGEICFQESRDTERLRKHFWWSRSHTGYQWWDAHLNQQTGQVRDNAETIRNRDSSCEVKVIDDRGWWPDDVFVADNDHHLYTLPDSVSNQNDRHQRFNC